MRLEVKEPLTTRAGTWKAVWMENQHGVAVSAATRDGIVHPPPEEDRPATVPTGAAVWHGLCSPALWLTESARYGLVCPVPRISDPSFPERAFQEKSMASADLAHPQRLFFVPGRGMEIL